MNIIINEGPNTKISVMVGQQLTLNNDPGKGLSIKVETPGNNTYTGTLYLNITEVDWLIKQLPKVRNRLDETGSVFLDTTKIKTLPKAIKDIIMLRLFT
jgi:hypothetical protein